METSIWLGIRAMFGANARYWLAAVVNRHCPIITYLINSTGSFLGGVGYRAISTPAHPLFNPLFRRRRRFHPSPPYFRNFKLRLYRQSAIGSMVCARWCSFRRGRGMAWHGLAWRLPHPCCTHPRIWQSYTDRLGLYVAVKPLDINTYDDYEQ
jgi:hypothetical protein